MTLVALLTAVTGVLLAPLAFLAVFSGYCMRSPWLTGILTIGLLGDYNLCSVIHSDIVPEVLAALGALHVILSSESLYRKYRDTNVVLRVLLEIYRVVAYMVGALAIALAITYTFML